MLSEAPLGLQTYPINSPSSIWAIWMGTGVVLCASGLKDDDAPSRVGESMC